MRISRQYIIFIFALIPGCMQVCQKPLVRRTTLAAQRNDSKGVSTAIDMHAQPPLTIWVHGTRLLPKGMFKNFFYCQPGLHHYSELEPKYRHHKVAKTLINSDPLAFPEQTFYLFGWDGVLSGTARETAATQLYHDLKQLRADSVQTYGCEPRICIITHSHGGNIALLLEKVKDQTDTAFSIDTLILLACPVQQKTMAYAHASLFKKIYSLYSMLDVLQVVDPQGLKQAKNAPRIPLFSGRHFADHEKIDQVAIKINDRSIMHIEFIKLSFLARLPRILAEIDAWKSSGLSPNWMKHDKCLSINTKTKHKPISVT